MATKVLLEVLAANKNTEIGKKYKFPTIKNVMDFQKQVPLSTYEDYRPYINRMVEHDEMNLIAPGKVVFYAPTSGTTSQSKLLPRFTPPPRLRFKSKKNLLFMSCNNDRSTVHGVPIIPGYNSVIGATITADPSAFVAPVEAFKLNDFITSLYVQLVFGLSDASVENIWAPFCPTVLTAFKVLCSEWRHVVADIKNGTLKKSLNLTEDQRKALEHCNRRPNLERASELETIFVQAELNGFKAVAGAIWPKLVTVDALAGGSTASYVPLVTHYLGNTICLISSVYAASEGPGLFGINTSPFDHQSAYTLSTEKVFFEFIPFSDVTSERDESLILTIDQIKAGEKYEIVFTTYEGLYRYRIGDVVKVLQVSSDNKPPLIELIGRSKSLSVQSEKLTDFQIGNAINALKNDFSWKRFIIQDYIVSADVTPIPPRHKFWIEVATTQDTSVVELYSADIACAEEVVDSQLSEVNEVYHSSRKRNMISCPKITPVKPGTFDKLLKAMKAKSSVTEGQLKIPRTTCDVQLIAILENSVAKIT